MSRSREYEPVVYEHEESASYWTWCWGRHPKHPLSRGESRGLKYKIDGLTWYHALRETLPTPTVFPRHFDGLDLGSGAGQIADHLSSHGVTVTGIDLNSHLVGWCNDHFSGRRDSESSFHIGDCAEVDSLFPSEHFDIVTAHMLMHLLPDQQFKQTLKGIYKVVKPGGHFIYMVPHPKWKVDPSSPGYWDNQKVIADTTPWGVKTTYHHRTEAYQADQLRKAGFIEQPLDTGSIKFYESPVELDNWKDRRLVMRGVKE